MDEGESTYEAALREASEEVGQIPADARRLRICVATPARDY